MNLDKESVETKEKQGRWGGVLGGKSKGEEGVKGGS